MNKEILKKIEKHNKKHRELLERQGYFLKKHTEFTDKNGRLKFGVDIKELKNAWNSY